eukprot:2935290-Pleurochrysis_carterae.AAC.4
MACKYSSARLAALSLALSFARWKVAEGVQGGNGGEQCHELECGNAVNVTRVWRERKGAFPCLVWK